MGHQHFTLLTHVFLISTEAFKFKSLSDGNNLPHLTQIDFFFSCLQDFLLELVSGHIILTNSIWFAHFFLNFYFFYNYLFILQKTFVADVVCVVWDEG